MQHTKELDFSTTDLEDLIQNNFSISNFDIHQSNDLLIQFEKEDLIEENLIEEDLTKEKLVVSDFIDLSLVNQEENNTNLLMDEDKEKDNIDIEKWNPIDVLESFDNKNIFD